MKPISPFALFALPLLLPLAHGQVVERIDVDSQGQPGDYGSAEADISDDGRWVVFVGTATTFGGPDVYGTKDVFIRDRQSGTTARLTSSLDASDPTRFSNPHISGNGAVVSYSKSGIVGGFVTNRSFVHRLGTSLTTEVVVPSLSDVLVTGLSGDGRFAAIQTGHFPNWSVYRLDLATNATVLCTRDGKGHPVAGRFGEIDDTGSRVSFQSSLPLVVPGDDNNTSDVFVLDIPSDTLIRASVNSLGAGANSTSYAGTISGNGRYVSFSSIATNLSPLDSTGNGSMYLHDLVTGLTTLVSINPDGTPMPGSAGERSCVSRNGEGVAFNSCSPSRRETRRASTSCCETRSREPRSPALPVIRSPS